jgi:hypothetical protein
VAERGAERADEPRKGLRPHGEIVVPREDLHEDWPGRRHAVALAVLGQRFLHDRYGVEEQDRRLGRIEAHDRLGRVRRRARRGRLERLEVCERVEQRQ